MPAQFRLIDLTPGTISPAQEITRAQVEAADVGVWLDLNMSDDPRAATFARYRLEKIDER